MKSKSLEFNISLLSLIIAVNNIIHLSLGYHVLIPLDKTAVSVSIYQYCTHRRSSYHPKRTKLFPSPIMIRARHQCAAARTYRNAFEMMIANNNDMNDANDDNDEPCLVGNNVVQSCDTGIASFSMTTDETSLDLSSYLHRGTQGKLSASVNIGKCICGAGSFALPHVFLNEGVLGGTLAMLVCGYLATITMQSINRSRSMMMTLENNSRTPTSYVELADFALGGYAAKWVFALTLAASLGVCSTYIVFIGQTMASLTAEVNNNNKMMWNIPLQDVNSWKVVTAAIALPLSFVRNYGIFAFTSALGVSAVLGGMMVTLAYGVFINPGGGIDEVFMAVGRLRMWPESFQHAFGGSFGTIAYLFCINFLTFPIINSMKDAERDYDDAVSVAVGIIWIVNCLFAIICLGFYGDETKDIILGNLDSDSVYLSALKVLLCIDLLFTFPIVFSSARQILENALLHEERKDNPVSRGLITGGAVATCLLLSQLGGFGVVANLVGGVAQGMLAFVMPPAIAIELSRRRRILQGNYINYFDVEDLPQWCIGMFGLIVVSSVTFYTLVELLHYDR